MKLTIRSVLGCSFLPLALSVVACGSEAASDDGVSGDSALSGSAVPVRDYAVDNRATNFHFGSILQFGLTRTKDTKRAGFYRLTETVAGDMCGPFCDRTLLNSSNSFDDVSTIDVLDGSWKIEPDVSTSRGSNEKGKLTVVMDDAAPGTADVYSYEYIRANGQLVIKDANNAAAGAFFGDAHGWTKTHVEYQTTPDFPTRYSHMPAIWGLNAGEFYTLDLSTDGTAMHFKAQVVKSTDSISKIERDRNVDTYEGDATIDSDTRTIDLVDNRSGWSLSLNYTLFRNGRFRVNTQVGHRQSLLSDPTGARHLIGQ